MAELKENSPDEVMCSCSGTTRGMIQDMVKQGKDLDAISRYSGALTGCGGCEWDIGEMVKELTANLPPATDQAETDESKPD
ncbi:MAG TPA: (2Fe-2S)-binding protein [Methylophilus sp.]|jgi:NAD(P)H-nitrite reductase large subunit|nr:(2Fe-2S)-binding protein [Methylophilus sp.]